MLDLNILRNLMNHDEAMVQRMLNIAKEQLPNMMSDLKQFIANLDYANVSIMAHSLKAQLLYLGATECAEIAQNIESFADKQDKNLIISDISQQLETNIQLLMKEF